MEQAAMAFAQVQALEARRARGASPGSAPVVLMLEVADRETSPSCAGTPRARSASASPSRRCASGVLALRAASGQIDAGAIREAGNVLVSEMRELLSSRAPPR